MERKSSWGLRGCDGVMIMLTGVGFDFALFDIAGIILFYFYWEIIIHFSTLDSFL